MDATAAVIAAAGVGFGHAVLPDHWVPLAVVGRTQRYSVARVARLSGAAGIAHVLVSLVLGAVIVAVGLQFRSTVEHAQNAIVGGLLIATAVLFLVFELTGLGHGHAHDHGHAHGEHLHHDNHHRHDHRHRSLLAVMVPFGAAASPDLTILPVFFAATAAGTGAAVASLIAFAAVTIVTIVTLTVSATVGGYRIRGHWLDRGSNLFTAAVLAAIGALVLAGVL